MIDPALYSCAPWVAKETLAQIIRVESRGQPFAVNINKGPRVKTPRSAHEAAGVINAAIAKGYNVDIGYMQVNSRNLPKLGLTVEQALDPCTNIRAGATILTGNYRGAVRIYGEGQAALQAALSAYNTGNFRSGFRNGYVSRYFAHGPSFTPSPAAGEGAPAAAAVPNRYAATSAVNFGKELVDGRKINSVGGPGASPISVD